jgi:hypothetical protein
MKSTGEIYKSIMTEALVFQKRDMIQALKKDEKVGEVKGYLRGKELTDDVYEVWIGPNKRYGGDAIWLIYNNGKTETPKWGLQSVLFGDEFNGQTGDALYIDMGQKWYVKGLTPILNKLRTRLQKVYNESNKESINEEYIASVIAKLLPKGLSFRKDDVKFWAEFSKAMKKAYPGKSKTWYWDMMNDEDLSSDVADYYKEFNESIRESLVASFEISDNKPFKFYAHVVNSKNDSTVFLGKKAHKSEEDAEDEAEQYIKKNKAVREMLELDEAVQIKTDGDQRSVAAVLKYLKEIGWSINIVDDIEHYDDSANIIFNKNFDALDVNDLKKIANHKQTQTLSVDKNKFVLTMMKK